MSIENRSSPPGDIRRIDLHTPGGRDELESLRKTLVSQGDLVSPAGRQRTIDVFGGIVFIGLAKPMIYKSFNVEVLCSSMTLFFLPNKLSIQNIFFLLWFH